MTADAQAALLVLHAVRLAGFASTSALAERFGVGIEVTQQVLRDEEVYGLVVHTSFADLDGWSLTDAGRMENERRLACELARTGAAATVRDVHADFLPLNERLQRAVTRWQMRPSGDDLLAANDHTDAAWDAAVLAELAGLDRELATMVRRLGGVLGRFRGYAERFSTALARARGGASSWVDGIDVDSCHRVWFELHEDLIATLGIQRGATVG